MSGPAPDPPIWFIEDDRRTATPYVGQVYSFAVVGAAFERAAGTPPSERRWAVGSLPPGVRPRRAGTS